MARDEFRKRIAREQAAGWRVKERADDWALLHKPNFGTKDGHVLIAVTTVWWTFGLANAAYALLKYWYDTPTKLVDADDLPEGDELSITSATEAGVESSRSSSTGSLSSAPSNDDPDDDADPPDSPDPISILRERYARGEIDEAEFERRVERLIETDTIEAAKRSREHERDREPAVERS